MHCFIKRNILGIIVIMLLMSLSGCTSNEEQKNATTRNFSSEYSVSGDRLSLDTRIETPAENIDEITVTPYELDTEKVKKAFLKDSMKLDGEKSGEMREVFEDSEGNRVSFFGSTGMEYSSNFELYIRQCFREEPGYEKYANGEQYYNADKYLTGKEFEFMSREEALKVVENQLKEFGINLGNIEYNCYSLDYNTLRQEEYAIDMDGKEDQSVYKDKWTKEDNCYYFCIRQKFNDIVEYHKEFGVMSKYDDAYSSIKALVSLEGIKYLKMEFALKFQQTGKKIKIKNPQQILDRISAQYGKVVGKEKYTINSFNLCYMTNSKDNYSVTPIYQCHMLEEGRDDPIIKSRVVQLLIDATTGEELE